MPIRGPFINRILPLICFAIINKLWIITIWIKPVSITWKKQSGFLSRENVAEGRMLAKKKNILPTNIIKEFGN